MQFIVKLELDISLDLTQANILQLLPSLYKLEPRETIKFAFKHLNGIYKFSRYDHQHEWKQEIDGRGLLFDDLKLIIPGTLIDELIGKRKSPILIKDLPDYFKLSYSNAGHIGNIVYNKNELYNNIQSYIDKDWRWVELGKSELNPFYVEIPNEDISFSTETN